MKETILKRLLTDGHITIEELIVLGQKDIYDTRDLHSFPPDFGKDLYLNITEWNKHSTVPYGYASPYLQTTSYHQSPTIVTSKL